MRVCIAFCLGAIRSTMVLAVILLAATTISVTVAYGQVEQCWVKRYDGPAHGNDVGKKIVLGSDGYVYVAGEVRGPGNLDYLIIKRNRLTGDTVWTRRYDGGGEDTLRGLAVYGDGVYVTGQTWSGTHWDFLTVKYDTSGNFAWAARDLGTVPWPEIECDEEAYAIAVDSIGVYVTGEARNSSLNDDVLTIRYNLATGALLDSARYNSGGNDYAVCITLDPSGNVYVAGGGHHTGHGFDYLVISYDPYLNQRWVNQYDGTGATQWDFAWDIAYDNAGYVWVTGESDGLLSDRDIATVRYRCSDGYQYCAARFDGDAHGFDKGYAVTADYGNAYVTGTTLNYFMMGQSCIVTIKYGPTGNEIWRQVTCSGMESCREIGYDICLDGGEGCYVAGRLMNSLHNYDYATLAYRKSNGQEWSTTYNGPAGGSDSALAIVAGGPDTVYVTGGSPGFGTGLDVATIKYRTYCIPPIVVEPNGGELWYARSQHNIIWNPDALPGTVTIEWSVNSGAQWKQIASVSASDGSYPWFIPCTDSEHCLVRICSNFFPSCCDVSDAEFTIHRWDDCKSCPYASVWNGDRFERDNNLLPQSESAISGDNVVDSYLMRKQPQPVSGKYLFQIEEFEHEHSWLDEVTLMTVDHSPATKVGVAEDGTIFTWANPLVPVTATSDQGQDYRKCLAARDNSVGSFTEGEVLSLTFGTIKAANGARLIVGFEKPTNPTSPSLTPTRPGQVNVAIAKQPVAVKGLTRENAFDADDPASTVHLQPRENGTIAIADVTSLLSGEENDYVFQLVFPAQHNIEFIGLDTSAQVPTKITRIPLRSATHSVQGNLTGVLSAQDGAYAELLPGENIELAFDCPAQPQGMRRDFVLISTGHYRTVDKQDDPRAENRLSIVQDLSSYPNPFNPETKIAFTLTQESPVRLEIYNLLGQRLRTLVDEVVSAGRHEVTWDGRDASGEPAASGIYFYRLTAGSYAESRKMVLAR